MPRVPTAEGFGVLPTIRSGGARPVLSVEQAAQPGRQMEARGAQMIQIGGQIGEYAQQQQERINRARVQDAYVQAQNFGRELELEQRKLAGQAAIGSTDAFGERYSKRVSELSKDLSPVAQEAFRAKADALYGGFLDRGTKYEADQFEVYENSVIDSTILSSAQNMQVYMDDPEVFGQSRQDTKDAIRMKATKAGLSGGAADQFVQIEMGKTHAVFIDNMLDGGDPRGAAAYFAQVSEDFLPTEAAAMQNKIDAGLAPAEASDVVSALLAEMPLEGLNIPTSDMDSWLRANIDNPVVLKAAQEDLRSRIAAHEEQYRNQQAEAYDTALTIAASRGVAAASGTAAWQSLDAKEQLSIQDYIESRTETRRARGAAAAGRKQTERREEQDMAYFDVVNGTPDEIAAFAALTPGQLAELRPKVGEANYAKLRAEHAKLNEGPERVYEVTMDTELFNGTAIGYGYDPLSNDKAQKLAVANLRFVVDQAIAAEQERAGKLTPAEKQRVMREVFARQDAPARVPVANWYGGTETRAITELTAEQLTRVPINAIPEAERLQIVTALGERYNATGDERFNPENPNNIRALYLAARGVGVTND